MKKRVFEFDGADGKAAALAQVMEKYAHAAYPPGGSECASVTRAAMLDLVAALRASDIVKISTRQRPTLVSAVSWFYVEMEKTDDPMYQMLTEQLERQ